MTAVLVVRTYYNILPDKVANLIKYKNYNIHPNNIDPESTLNIKLLQ